MLWILLIIGILGAAIMLVATIDEMLSRFRDWKDVGNYAIRMVIFIVIGSVGFLGIRGINALSYEEVAQTGDWELVSLTNNRELSGSGSSGLFYVHISIDTDEVFSFYYEVNNDGIKRGKVDADYTTIYEKDDCTPHVVEYTTYTKNKMNEVLRAILTFRYGESSQKTYEIYIPTGTILRTFSQDSQ